MRPNSKLVFGIILMIGVLLLILFKRAPAENFNEKQNPPRSNYQSSFDKNAENISHRDSRPTARYEGESRKGDQNVLTTIIDFENAYSGILQNFEGDQRRLETDKLLILASDKLSLVDFELFTENIKDLNSCSYAFILLGSKYAAEDPNKGYEWLKSLTNDSTANSAFASFAKGLPRETLSQAIEFALSLNNRTSTASFLSGLLCHGDRESVLAVIRVANDNPSEQINGILSIAPLEFLNRNETAEAVDVCNSIENDKVREASYRNIIIQTVQRSPVEAARAFSSIPNESDRNGVIDALVEPWVRSDPEAASAWVGKLEAGVTRDKAIPALISGVLRANQGDALEWAMTIGSDSVRKHEINRIIAYAKSFNNSQVENLILRARQGSSNTPK